MADWRESRVPASFRGVSFFVVSTDLGIGRRTVQHVYPFKKEPAFSEDMGRKPRSFTVEGFVVGTEYEAARDALVEALEKEGPGELIHPTHGTRRVAVGSGGVVVRESSDEGGMARFSIPFDETPPKAAQPSAVVNAKAALRATAEKAKLAVGLEFLAKYSPGTLLSSVSGQLGAASRAMNTALATVQMGTQEIAALKRQVTALASDAAALAAVPADLLATQVEIFETLADGLLATSLDALDVVSPVLAVLSLYGFNPGVRPPGTTANRLIEQANFDATQHLTQRLVVIQASVVAVEQTFESFDAAIAARAAITDLIDDQAETVADDVYPVMLQLRADLVKAIPGDALELARLVQHTPAFTLPSLVLAHSLYGDLALESDLVRRNRIQNPAFVRGGEELEVLTRG